MRIAFIYKYFPSYGGVERVITLIANELIKRGLEVDIYSYQQKLDKPAYPLNNNIKILPLPDNKKIDSMCNIDYLVKDLIVNKTSVIFNHDSTSDSMRLCQKVKDKTALPLVVLHHNQIYLSWSSLFSIVRIWKGFNVRKIFFPIYYFYVLMRDFIHHKKNVHTCDFYVVLSKSFQRQLGASAKIWAIGNPLSFQSFFNIDQYTEKENVVLMVGRISEFHKRFSLALKIWQIIEKKTAFSSWRFEIVGDGGDLSMVKRKITELGLRNVVVVGYADPEAYYKRAKILFMTSAFEGFPLVLLEAAQNGCVPIVMDSFEAVHDIIEDKINGFIIPNGDIESFALSVQTLMNHPEQLCEMAKSAVESSHQYEPSILVDKWVMLFDELNTK